MMEQLLVSVIIPAYNSERYIEETLLSVMTQSYSHLEIIVVDDGSTDSQKNKILELEKTDSRIKYVYQENKGVSAARNNGFAHAKGMYLAFLDADDVWLPDNISAKLEKLESDDYGLVHSDSYLMDENSTLTGETMSGCEGLLLDAMLTWNATQIPGPSSILLKREVMDRIGLFDTNLSTSADHDFFLRVAAQFRIGRLSRVTWKYRLHPYNMHKNISLMEKDVLYVYRKASSNRFFKSRNFERKCYANMYLILAASWAGDGQNKNKGVYFTLLAIKSYPGAGFNIVKRILKKCFQN